MWYVYNNNLIVFCFQPTTGSIINLDKLLKVNLEHLLQASMSRLNKPKPVETQNIVPPAKSSIFSVKAPPLAPLSPATPSASAEKSSVVVKSANGSAKQVMIQIEVDEELEELSSSQSTVESSSKESSTVQVDKPFQEPLVTLKHRSYETRTAIENAVDPLDLDYSELASETDLNMIDLSEDNEYDVLTDNTHTIKNSARELTGKDLFRCGNINCEASFEIGADFKYHVFSCALSKHFNGLYQCYHCRRQWKSIRGLLEHIMVSPGIAAKLMGKRCIACRYTFLKIPHYLLIFFIVLSNKLSDNILYTNFF